MFVGPLVRDWESGGAQSKKSCGTNAGVSRGICMEALTKRFSARRVFTDFLPTLLAAICLSYTDGELAKVLHGLVGGIVGLALVTLFVRYPRWKTRTLAISVTIILAVIVSVHASNTDAQWIFPIACMASLALSAAGFKRYFRRAQAER